jgi:hypothetical protein
MKKVGRKFVERLLFALLILTVIIGFYAWHIRDGKPTISAKKTVPMCGKPG